MTFVQIVACSYCLVFVRLLAYAAASNATLLSSTLTSPFSAIVSIAYGTVPVRRSSGSPHEPGLINVMRPSFER